MKCARVLLFSALAFVSPAWGQPPPLLIDFSRIQHKPGEVTTPANEKVSAGTVELVEGQFGKACKFSFAALTGPQFFTAWVNPSEDWDQYEGFSFWVRGDGSKSYGGLEFIDGNDYALRFGYCFPIESTDWVKVTVPWSDLVPELSAPTVDARHGFAPSRFRNVWVGKWHYWREYPACSFTIERMSLEKHVERNAINYTPREPGLPRVLAKLKARQPVTIVTMGDSLSDKRHGPSDERLFRRREFRHSVRDQRWPPLSAQDESRGRATFRHADQAAAVGCWVSTRDYRVLQALLTFRAKTS